MTPIAGPDPRAPDLSSLLLPVDSDQNGSPPQTSGAAPVAPPVDDSAAGATPGKSPVTPPEASSAPSGDRSGDLRDQSISDVVKQVQSEASTLLSGEVKLAKAEMTGKAKKIGAGAGLLGAAGLMGALALFALMLCLIFALATGMPDWLAALIVTVVFVAAAAGLALAGKAAIKKAGPPIPEETVESVKQTIETVKEEAKWGLGQTR